MKNADLILALDALDAEAQLIEAASTALRRLHRARNPNSRRGQPRLLASNPSAAPVPGGTIRENLTAVVKGMNGSFTVDELVGCLPEPMRPKTRPAATQHMKHLMTAGVVERVTRGIYRGT